MLCPLHHAIDLSLRREALLVGSDELPGLACGLSAALMLDVVVTDFVEILSAP